METLRINLLNGRSVVVMIDKIIYLEEDSAGESTFIHLINDKVIQCTENIYNLQEILNKRIKSGTFNS